MYLRAKPHGLFRRHRRAARTAPGFVAGTHRQYCFVRPPGGQTGFRRPAIGKGLRTHESLWPLALQHTFHARTRPPPAWHGDHGQLPASRLRRHALRRPKRRRDLALRWLAKLFAISPEKGAETIIYLASSAAVTETTGAYFYKCRPIAPSQAAWDDRAALLLWERSAGLADLITAKRPRKLLEQDSDRCRAGSAETHLIVPTALRPRPSRSLSCASMNVRLRGLPHPSYLSSRQSLANCREAAFAA
jgi:hypothetical protein